MKDYGPHLVSGRQVDGGHGADALAVQYDVLGADAVGGPQRLPSGVNVRVQVPLAGLAVADAVPGIVVAEYVAVDPHAQSLVEAAHLAQVDGVSVRKQYCVTGVGTAPQEYARYAIAAGRARVEALNVLHVAVGVLPLGLVVELDVVLGLATVHRREVVRDRRRQERQLGGNAGRQGWTAEQVHQLAERHPVHCKHIGWVENEWLTRLETRVRWRRWKTNRRD